MKRALKIGIILWGLIVTVYVAGLGLYVWQQEAGFRGSITDLTGYTGKVGYEDLNFGTPGVGVGSEETFSVPTYTGASTTLTKIYDSQIPIISQVSEYVGNLFRAVYSVVIYPEDIIAASPWVDLRKYTSLAAALADLGTSDEVTLVIPKSHTLLTGATITSNYTLLFVGTGDFLLANGISLELDSCKIVAPDRQIFRGNGTVTGTPANGYMLASWWGNDHLQEILNFSAQAGTGNPETPYGFPIKIARHYGTSETSINCPQYFQLFGDSMQFSVLEYTGAASDFLTFPDGTGQHNVILRNLSIVNTGSGAGAIVADFSSGSWFSGYSCLENVRFYNWGAYSNFSIYMKYLYDVKFDNVHVAGSDKGGIYLEHANACALRPKIIDVNQSDSDGMYGIEVASSLGVSFSHVYVEPDDTDDLDAAVYIYGSSDVDVNGYYIEGQDIDAGFKFGSDSAGGRCRATLGTGIISISSTDGDAFQFHRVDSVEIHSPHVYRCNKVFSYPGTGSPNVVSVSIYGGVYTYTTAFLDRPAVSEHYVFNYYPNAPTETLPTSSSLQTGEWRAYHGSASNEAEVVSLFYKSETGTDNDVARFLAHHQNVDRFAGTLETTDNSWHNCVGFLPEDDKVYHAHAVVVGREGTIANYASYEISATITKATGGDCTVQNSADDYNHESDGTWEAAIAQNSGTPTRCAIRVRDTDSATIEWTCTLEVMKSD